MEVFCLMSPCIPATFINGHYWWVIWVIEVAKGKYHSDKVYLPKDIRDRLGLKNGAEVEFTVREEDEVVMKVLDPNADQKLLEILSRPRNLGVKGKLTREEIYASA